MTIQIHSIAVDKGCTVTVGDVVHVDFDGMNGYYKGDFTVRGIQINDRGQLHVGFIEDDGAEAWLPVNAVKF